MTPLMNALACVMSLCFAVFLWREKISIFKDGALIFCFFVVSCCFAFFVGDVDDPLLEYLPLRMLALCLCVSTTSLPHKRRRYLVLAQAFWVWVELFGGISLAYRGIEFAWTRVLAIAAITLCSTLLSKISREMEFCLLVFWIAIWMFF